MDKINEETTIYEEFLRQAVKLFVEKQQLPIQELHIGPQRNGTLFTILGRLDDNYKVSKVDTFEDDFVDFVLSQTWEVDVSRGFKNIGLTLGDFNTWVGFHGSVDLQYIIEDTEKAKLKGTKKPDDVSFILKRLNDAGYSAYVVGGCVRDASMKRDPHDWDITTSAKPDQVEKVFEDHKIIETGLKHGTVTVMRNGEGYEITTYRIDGDYSDGRHPDSVAFTGDVVEDLKRRDFTMNAIALDNNGDVVDPFDGCSDIYSRKVRAVGSPVDRFNEDALRIMRAIRFAAVFDFEIDDETKWAIFKLYPNLKKVSKERINAELIKMAKSPRFFRVLSDYAPILAYVMGVDGFIINARVESEDIITKFATMFRTIEDAETVMNDLKFDGETRDSVIQLVKWRDYGIEEDNSINIKLWLNQIGEEQLYRLGKIKGKDLTIPINKVKNDCYNIKDLAVNGNDVMALGYKGKEVGEILNKVLNEVIYERLENDKNAIIAYIQTNN